MAAVSSDVAVVSEEEDAETTTTRRHCWSAILAMCTANGFLAELYSVCTGEMRPELLPRCVLPLLHEQKALGEVSLDGETVLGVTDDFCAYVREHVVYDGGRKRCGLVVSVAQLFRNQWAYLDEMLIQGRGQVVADNRAVRDPV